MKRHGTLTLRTAEPLAYARAVCSQPEILNHYYNLLEQTLLEHDLADKPNQVFNLDELGMPLDPHPPRIIAVKGIKHPTSITTCMLLIQAPIRNYSIDPTRKSVHI